MPAATDWAHANATFTTPANATSVQIYHLIKRTGFLVTDDYVFGAEPGFDQGMVSVTFDDSYADHFSAVRPILATNAIPATFYVISGLLGQSNRMTVAQVQQLASDGHEIGSHSIVHPT